jgi:outer membrane lipoprotein carrier protein
MTPRWLSALAALFLNVPLAAAPDAHAIARAVESRYQRAKTLKATFFEAYQEGGGRRISESGTVYFSRPGRMRWEYESPQSKLFVVDGTNAWFYVPANHTASRAKIKQSSDWRTPLGLLAGKADLGQLCRDIELVDPSAAKNDDEKALAAGDVVLRCTPKGDASSSDLKGVTLEVDPQDYLVHVVIREAGDISTEFRFGNWQANIAVPEAQFHFQPPAGVSIVDEGGLQDELH